MPDDPPFEQWVSRQLQRAYDEVLAEDVPPELLELVERWQSDGSVPEPEAPPAVKKRKGQS